MSESQRGRVASTEVQIEQDRPQSPRARAVATVKAKVIRKDGTVEYHEFPAKLKEA